MKKKIFMLFFLSVLSFSNELIKSYENFENENVDYTLFQTEKLKRPYDNYVFAKKTANLRKGPSVADEKVGVLRRYKRAQVLELVKNDDDENWFKVLIDGEESYVHSKLVIYRKYNFDGAIKNIEKLKAFITKYQNRLKVINKFEPLSTTEDNEIDEFGNSANQSITVYTDINQSKHYNLQDRSIISIIGETKNFYIIVSPFYNQKLYYKKEDKRYFSNVNIKTANKYIYISKKDQNELSFEVKDGIYYPITISDVTTGRKSKYGFKTPTGMFLVAITKPMMFYTRDDDETNEIAGEAKYAIRFSGGAYMHGIPSLYEPAETLEQRKKATESVLGTYGVSHKCVRNYDEVVKILYDWIGYKSINSIKHRTPKEPVFVIVE